FAHEELAPYGPLEIAIFYDAAMNSGHAASMAERAFARIATEFHDVFEGKAGDNALFALRTPLGTGVAGSGLIESNVRARAAVDNPQETRFHNFLATARIIAGDRQAGGLFLEETESGALASAASQDAGGDGDPRRAHRQIAEVLRLGLGRARPVFRTAPARMVLEKAADAGVLAKPLSMRLTAGYEFVSGMASRIQYIKGGSSFTISTAEEKQALAALCGFADFNALDSVRAGAVADAVSARPLLAEGPQAEFNQYKPTSNQPDDIDKLEDLGFRDGQYLSRVVDGWAGLADCDESQRFSAVAPGLLTEFGQTQHPDEAIALFDTLIETLKADETVMDVAREESDARSALVDALGCFGGVIAPLVGVEPGARCVVSAHDQERCETGAEWMSRQPAPSSEASLSDLAAWRREKIALIALSAAAGSLSFGAAGDALKSVHDATLKAVFDRVMATAKIDCLAVHVFDNPTYGLPGAKTS
ncbi:MAG: hypothetical protein AAGJ87_15880, partial [Pseudomonadota bacterium]